METSIASPDNIVVKIETITEVDQEAAPAIVEVLKSPGKCWDCPNEYEVECSTTEENGLSENQIDFELSERLDKDFGPDESINEVPDTVLCINAANVNITIKDLWDCPYCPYKATKLDLMHIHIADTHASVTCYKCQTCQYAHAQLSLVIEHVGRRHQNVKYQCPDCKIKFTTVWNCEGHILIRHPKKAQKLLDLLMLKRELERTHKKCPFCQYEHNSPGILKRHVERTHPEVVIFKCWFCTYKNVDIDVISDHMKTMHPDEREGDI